MRIYISVAHLHTHIFICNILTMLIHLCEQSILSIREINMSNDAVQLIKKLYEYFNARNIDGVLASLNNDAAWANGMDGGHVYGHDVLRNYWTRQWSIVSPHVEPKEFHCAEDGSIFVKVIQSVFDL